jgi:hypothetical protein
MTMSLVIHSLRHQLWHDTVASLYIKLTLDTILWRRITKIFGGSFQFEMNPRTAWKSFMYLYLDSTFDLQDELHAIMRKNRIDYTRSSKRQESNIVGQVIDEVPANTLLLSSDMSRYWMTTHDSKDQSGWDDSSCWFRTRLITKDDQSTSMDQNIHEDVLAIRTRLLDTLTVPEIDDGASAWWIMSVCGIRVGCM